MSTTIFPGQPATTRRGDWIQTYSGVAFWPLDPRVEEIRIEDIAHSLSLQCRYAGHTRDFYSVAQHSVIVSEICDPEDAIWGLLHDGGEAYLIDLPRPIKHLPDLSAYRAAERALQAVIMERFGIRTPEPESVQRADRAMLWIEYRDQLIGREHADAWRRWREYLTPRATGIDVRFAWNPRRAEDEFLRRFYALAEASK